MIRSRFTTGLALCALVLSASACSSDEPKSSPTRSASAAVPSEFALPETCAEWSGLDVGDSYQAVTTYLRHALRSKPTDEQLDTLRQGVNEGCADDPPVQPYESADDLIATLGWDTR